MEVTKGGYVLIDSSLVQWLVFINIGEDKNKSVIVYWKVIYVLLKCNHRIAHILRHSKRDDNLLTFVRLASCVMIRDLEDNTYPFLRKGRQFVGEFGDAFEVEAVGWRDGHLEKDSDIFGDVNGVNGFCG